MTTRPAPFVLAGHSVAPGTRCTIELPVSSLSDHTPVTMSVHVIHGKRPGPVMFVSAAIHGDEVIGVEIVRRLLRARPLHSLAGTLMAVPIVNTFGFLNHARYLPDRRDLNRCFPGTPEGSLGARLAHIFLEQIVKRADMGIDLHSAAIQRTNLPQIRLTPGNARLRQLGEAFGAPVMLRSKLREGSLRMAAEEAGVDVLLYEAGEGLRFDELAARTGVAGILRVMHKLGMISARGVPRAPAPPSPAIARAGNGRLRGGCFGPIAPPATLSNPARLWASSPILSVWPRWNCAAMWAALLWGAPICPWSTRARRCFTLPKSPSRPMPKRRSRGWPRKWRPSRCLTKTKSSRPDRRPIGGATPPLPRAAPAQQGGSHAR